MKFLSSLLYSQVSLKTDSMKLKSAINIKEISDSSIGYRLFNCVSRHARGVLSEIGAFLIVIILLSSCHDKPANEIIENSIGSVVSFPRSLKPVHKDTYHRTPSEFTIITYNKEENCMGCSMRLMSWEDFMDSVETIVSPGRVALLIVSESKNEKALWALKRRSDFHHEILIDTDNDFAEVNADIINNDLKSQTFLLDSNNRIIYYGNPLDDSNVRKDYFSYFKGKETPLTITF